MNRIRGLLNLQGVRHIDPNRSNWENELVNLRTGDGRSFPRPLMNEVRREGKLLGTVVRMLKEVEAEIAGMIRDDRKRRHPAQRGQNHPIARRLAEIRGVGPQTAGILATEVFYRGFKNRREVASYVGVTPTPYNSGTTTRTDALTEWPVTFRATQSSLSGHSLQLRAYAGRTGFSFERTHWCRWQTARRARVAQPPHRH